MKFKRSFLAILLVTLIPLQSVWPLVCFSFCPDDGRSSPAELVSSCHQVVETEQPKMPLDCERLEFLETLVSGDSIVPEFQADFQSGYSSVEFIEVFRSVQVFKNVQTNTAGFLRYSTPIYLLTQKFLI